MDNKINIIMFSMSHYTDWQKGRVNRNYHILRELEKDERIDKIVSVDFLPFNWKKVAKIYWENVIGKMENLDMVYGDLTSACHRVNNKLYIYSTVDSIYSEKMVVHEIERIIKVLNLSNVVFWSYNPLFTMLLEEVARKKVDRRAFVFDAVDNWLEHPAFGKKKADIDVGYRVINQDADLIFTVSEYLQDKVFHDNKKCIWVPNGIDNEHFLVPQVNYQIPEDLRNIKKPIIGYYGIIEGRVDLDLIKYLAEKNPDKSIVMIGSNAWRSHEKVLHKELSQNKNVYLLPFVSYQELPKYLAAFDVAIVPHKINELTKSMNPLKVYEYCAAGKPVVTIPVSGSQTFGNILYYASTLEEFNKKIEQALKEDNEDKQRIRREAVADDSWFGRVQVMLKYLFDVLDK